MFISLSCSAQKIDKNNTESYKVLNSLIDNLLDKKNNDTILIDNKTYNKGLKNIIENKKIIPKLRGDIDLIDIFSNESEIKFLKQQLEKPFFIDFAKINSKKVYEYIDPFNRKDTKGSIIVDEYYFIATSKINYTISKPIFTRNNLFSFMVVSASGIYIQIQAYKKEGNKWVHYKHISYP